MAKASADFYFYSCHNLERNSFWKRSYRRQREVILYINNVARAPAMCVNDDQAALKTPWRASTIRVSLRACSPPPTPTTTIPVATGVRRELPPLLRGPQQHHPIAAGTITPAPQEQWPLSSPSCPTHADATSTPPRCSAALALPETARCPLRRTHWPSGPTAPHAHVGRQSAVRADPPPGQPCRPPPRRHARRTADTPAVGQGSGVRA